MKTTALWVTSMAMAASTLETSRAGDREWATAGKVLTGIFAAGVVADVLRGPSYVATYAPPPVTVYAPAPVAPVVVAHPVPPAPPAPVAAAPYPVSTTVYTPPAPTHPAGTVVYYAAPPVVLAPPAPVVTMVYAPVVPVCPPVVNVGFHPHRRYLRSYCRW